MYLKIITFACLVAFLYACASVGTPSGGEKDTRPPKIRMAIPKDQSLMYKGRKITLVFNEPINVRNIKSNLAITPNTNNDYEYKINKNILTLDFKKDFEPNTTYVFDFSQVIEDLTEKNQPKNMKIAFSTGNSIDSLYISGIVKDFLTNKPEKDAIVALYNAKDTFQIQKHKPLYFARTDLAGRYKINNVKNQTYKVYALKEPKKTDLIYNGVEEKIGFLDSTLFLDGMSRPETDFVIIPYDAKPMKMTSARPRKQYFEVKANKKIYNYTVDFQDDSYKGKILYALDKDILRFYNFTGKNSTDSLKAFISLSDSVENTMKDTISIKFDALGEKDKKAQTAFSFTETPKSGYKLSKNEELQVKITFSKPILAYQIDSMSYKIDKDTIVYQFKPEEITLNQNRTELTIQKKLKIKEKADFTLKKAAFISIDQDTSSSRPLAYSLKKESEFGTISGVVKTKQPNFILQLLNEDEEVEQELKNATNFKFTYVVTGKKKFKVIIDKNANGKWDRGSFEKNEQPEPIFFVPEEIKLPPNWDVEDIIIEIDKNDE